MASYTPKHIPSVAIRSLMGVSEKDPDKGVVLQGHEIAQILGSPKP